MRDWRLIFTNAFRSKSIQKHLDKIFKKHKRIKISREEMEQSIVQICSLIMEGLDKETEEEK